ncbi:hypothetical protein Y1Q_0021062 [Alligator mississippiensis]|uniref:Uncharacterized protein n=1 Tax=Alligator mississippiensis TaxID=8496 RepID=A0A151NRE6_ALLMI|nr:hypothetical protein Y1Q_0021062 [Alligator mississippiensis]
MVAVSGGAPADAVGVVSDHPQLAVSVVASGDRGLPEDTTGSVGGRVVHVCIKISGVQEDDRKLHTHSAKEGFLP